MMSPTDADRIDIRRQQIEQCQDMIAWEKRHNWGNGTEFHDLSDRLVGDWERIVATLETVIARLEARIASQAHRD